MDSEDKRLLEASASGQTDRVLQLIEEHGQQLHKYKDQVSEREKPFEMRLQVIMTGNLKDYLKRSKSIDGFFMALFYIYRMVKLPYIWQLPMDTQTLFQH